MWEEMIDMQANTKEMISTIQCYLLDMDGTFYLGDRLIPGSLDFIQKLADTGKKALFLTNNSSRTAQYYVEKLTRMGVPEAFRNVLTSGQATARELSREFPGKKAYILANTAVKQEMAELGLTHAEENPDFVLIAFDTTLDYEKMIKVCDYVRAGLPYFATHPDYNCPTENGFIPDIGATIAYIKASTGRVPDRIIGKPNEGIVQEALRVTGQAKENLAMVGDRLYTDIATGVNFGMTSILVMSGETTKEMLEQSEVQPTLVFNCLVDIIPYI